MSALSAVVSLRVSPGYMMSRTRSIGSLASSAMPAQIVLGDVLDDLAAVTVVGGRDHEGVAVLLRELEGLLHGLVEVDGLADLAARVGRMVALVDRRALDL